MILAADIGGTNIRAAVIDSEGSIADETHSRIDLGKRDLGETELLERLTGFFAPILNSHSDIRAIGIGFPGFFLGDSGVLTASPNLPNLKQVDLAGQLSDSLNLPVCVQNDALCAAIGEQHFGAGRGHSSLLHLTLGTGIGGGLIINNAPYYGDGGMAMEFGHLRVAHDDQARLCGCGGRGCVEAYASATAISAQYEEANRVNLSAEEIYQRAGNADETAQNIIRNAGSYLGMAIAEAVKLLDVRTVTISGGLTGAWDILHPAMTTALNNNLIPPLKSEVSVLRSTLDDNAGLLGAAALATS